MVKLYIHTGMHTSNLGKKVTSLYTYTTVVYNVKNDAIDKMCRYSSLLHLASLLGRDKVHGVKFGPVTV